MDITLGLEVNLRGKEGNNGWDGTWRGLQGGILAVGMDMGVHFDLIHGASVWCISLYTHYATHTHTHTHTHTTKKEKSS